MSDLSDDDDDDDISDYESSDYFLEELVTPDHVNESRFQKEYLLSQKTPQTLAKEV